MKKKLEADLISIAHRILQLKNKSDVNQLFLETQKLYEKLAILRFVDSHFSEPKPTIGLVEMEAALENAFDENIEIPEAETENEPKTESIFEAETNQITPPEITAFDLTETKTTTTETVEISFEELVGAHFDESIFIKAEIPAETTSETPLKEEKKQDKAVSLNEKLGRTILIDLNDRIAFTKHLFANNPQDYIRVMNQIITFDTHAETLHFIKEIVKPDYNNWEGKQEYEDRLMEIIEKKFQ